MADEPDAVEEAGQAPVEDAPQAEAVAPDESTDIVMEDAAGDEAVQPEAVTEGDPEAEVEQDTPEIPLGDASSLDDVLERFPHLRGQLETRDQERENAGAQRREAQLRREAGSREQTAERLQSIKDRLKAGDDGVDDDLNFLDENNLANATQRTLGEFTQGLVRADGSRA